MQIPIIEILLAALSIGPKIVIYGLTDACKNVLPIPLIKDATRKRTKLSYRAEGIKRANAIAKRRNDSAIVLLYPIFPITSDAGYPKIINVEKVAARIRYDSPEETPRVPFNTGIRNEFMPSANPIAKNIIPIKAIGIAKFLFLFIFQHFKLG